VKGDGWGGGRRIVLGASRGLGGGDGGGGVGVIGGRVRAYGGVEVDAGASSCLFAHNLGIYHRRYCGDLSRKSCGICYTISLAVKLKYFIQKKKKTKQKKDTSQLCLIVQFSHDLVPHTPQTITA
jgi:hypothetical protein